MITRDLWQVSHAGSVGPAFVSTGARCEEWLAAEVAHRPSRPRESYSLAIVPHCACCGAASAREGGGSVTTWPSGQTRCARHHDRNPCAIEGCKRSLSASGDLRSDLWLCGEHWRRYVPPRQARRRAYHAFFRRAKRHGWDADLRRKFWRYWFALVAQARRKAEGGSINVAEIERLFG